MDIQLVSASLATSSTDIRNFTHRYKISDLEFSSLALIGMQDFYSFLKANSEIVSMNKRYYMRPDYVSYDFYGTTNLYFLLLYVNDCMSAMDFVIPQFYVPNNTAVIYIVSKQLTEYRTPTKELEV